jgi:aspartate-semialdehyde dehydrogenase
VGEEFLKLIIERATPVEELRLFASDRSVGQTRTVSGKSIPIQSLSEKSFAGLDAVFFSSGDDISATWAPVAVKANAFAIDNSANFRLEPSVPLIVPEVNAQDLPPRELPSIVANPNCSTIELVLALKPLQDHFGISQVRVATYQAVSGAGRGAREELVEHTRAALEGTAPPNPQVFPQSIGFNCLPQIGTIGEDGFCSEERKIRLETRKILDLPNLKISAWTVRVPVLNAHSEAVWVTLETGATRSELLSALKTMPGLNVFSAEAEYPTALTTSGQNAVSVGRIHQDPDDPKTWLMWIVGDNLRKGAALNGLQIAEKLFGIH